MRHSSSDIHSHKGMYHWFWNKYHQRWYKIWIIIIQWCTTFIEQLPLHSTSRNKMHIHMASFIQLNISFSWVWDTCLASWTIVAAEVWNQWNANINTKSNLKPLTNPSTLLHIDLLYLSNSNSIDDVVNRLTVHKLKTFIYLTDNYMWWDTLNNLHGTHLFFFTTYSKLILLLTHLIIDYPPAGSPCDIHKNHTG